MAARFINRTDERSKLEALWPARGSQMALLYGRRRLGKSYLLDHVFVGKRGVRHIVTQSTTSVILREFLEAAADQLGDADLTIDNYPNWRAAFRYFAEHSINAPLYLILDEFGYLMKAQPDIASTIQAVWTAFATQSQLKLILCGSQVTLLSQLVDHGGRPLFGHTNYVKLLKPLTYKDAAEFVAGGAWSRRDQLLMYGCLGGSGRYLNLVDEAQSFAKNLTNLVIDEGALHDEGALVLQTEEGITELALYNSVMSAIAQGATRRGDIINQFLVETIILSGTGGLIGVVLGMIIPSTGSIQNGN